MTELEQLSQRVDELAEALAKSTEDRDAYHELYLETLERCRKLERGLLGQKAERLPTEQPHRLR